MCPCGHPELIQNETQELEQPTTNIYTNQMFILNYWVKIETSSNTDVLRFFYFTDSRARDIRPYRNLPLSSNIKKKLKK